MERRDKIQFRELVIWLRDQLSHPHTLLKRKTWGVFSVYAHVRRSDHRPKKITPSREKALAAALSMEERYGGRYSVYKCLYCNGWHIAKEQDPHTSGPDTTRHIAPLPVSNTLNIEKIAELNIPDFAPVYGGVRGRTMSSRHQSFAWPTIREAGIRTVIDLREDGVYTRLSDQCREFGLEYFYYPVDNRCENIESMVRLFPEFCKHIDKGNFYIACAMGLHRTDIALCLYWVFYAADKGVAPPEIRGYRRDNGHNTVKIMRVINGFYRYLTESSGTEPMSVTVLKERKSIIEAKSRNLI